MYSSELSQKLSKISSQIEELTQLKYKIQTELKEVEKQAEKETFEALGIKEGSCLVLFSKTPVDAFYIIKTLRITSIDIDTHTVSVVCGSYSTKYNEKTFSVKTEILHFSTLGTMKEVFNIYCVDEVELGSMNQNLCRLTADLTNFEDLHTKIQSIADSIIE